MEIKKINIKGPIIPSNHQWIYDWLDMEGTSPKKVLKALDQAKGEDVEIHINSGGGSVFAGSEIYTALMDYAGGVTVKIVGLAASAASVIAMAGKKVMMSPTSQMMIHNAASIAIGDYRDMQHESEVLKTVNRTIASAYRLKSGLSEQELLNLMNEETWFSPEQALNKKLIDEIMFEENRQLVASFDYTGMLPQQVIDKITAEFFKKPNDLESDSNPYESRLALKRKRLNLLSKI